MNTPSTNQDKNHHFPAEIISHDVWLCFRQETRQPFLTGQEVTSIATAT
jgi:hypothetical protein